jgi:hypothetical protein
MAVKYGFQAPYMVVLDRDMEALQFGSGQGQGQGYGDFSLGQDTKERIQ